VIGNELERSENFSNRRLRLNHLSGSGSGGDAGNVHFLTSLLRCVLSGIVFLDTLQKVFVAPGAADMLDAEVHALTQLPVSDYLCDFDADSRFGHVENDTSSSVVELERHTLLLRRITDNVDVVTSLEGSQEGGEAGNALSAVGLGEFVSGASALTEGVRHFE